MTLNEALSKAKDHIATVLKASPDWVVNIYLWPTDPNIGVRVAEVSVSINNFGSSWMQSDIPHGLAVCAQVERVLLEYVGIADDLSLQLELLTEALTK